jgi:Papain family cysteine protease/Secretion system C-terminal sorting domain
MKLIKIFTLTISLFLCLGLNAQTITIDSTFTTDGEIFPFSTNDTIHGLSISGNVVLNCDTSLVRVLFIDTNYNQYMIYEVYPLIAEEMEFEFDDVFDETFCLDNPVPFSIEIQIIDAEFHLESIVNLSESCLNVESSRFNAKRDADGKKIATMNERIAFYDMDWLAGDQYDVSLYYQEKVNLYGEKYNLWGFDYYESGVFELLGYRNYSGSLSPLVRSFDWRNRHDANTSSSMYFDYQTDSSGWVTKLSNQGGCGSCWVFGPVAIFETVTNLYFNQHLDFDLSEQHLFSCSDDVSCGDGSFDGPAIDYALVHGLKTEHCFPYYLDTLADQYECSDTCIVSDTLVFANARIDIDKDDDSIKQALINYGPISCNTKVINTLIGHIMALVGYKTNMKDSTTIWIFKDSRNSPRFIPVNGSPGLIMSAFAIDNPISIYDVDPSREYEVQCNDKDGDGYCWWGIGPKPDTCPDCPDQPDCNDNDPLVGPYDENYFCSCNLQYTNTYQHISSDTTWSDSLSIDHNIVIDYGACLTIQSHVGFTSNAKVIVDRGGKLTIDNGVLSSVCDEIWGGIEVWGWSDSTQHLEKVQGRVVVKNGGRIEKAEIGVLLGKKDQTGFVSGFEGGIVLASDAEFINNDCDVRFRPYQNIHPLTKIELLNLSSFKSCVFGTDNNSDWVFETNKHLILESVKDIHFEGCVFRGSDPTDSWYQLDKCKGIGIYATGSSFHVYNSCSIEPRDVCPDTCVVQSEFKNLKYGIYAIDWDPTRNYIVDNAVFYDNLTGIYLSGISNSSLVSNEFNMLPDGNALIEDSVFCGIYLDGCTAYQVENNYVSGVYMGFNSTNDRFVGFYVANSGRANNEIYNNSFNKVHFGVIAEGENRHPYQESGLQIKCNEFNLCASDIAITPTSCLGIAPHQGANSTLPTAIAGNLFYIPGPANDDFDDLNNEGELFYYYYPDDVDGYGELRLEPKDFTENTVVETEVDFQYPGWKFVEGCPSHLDQGGGGIKSLRSDILLANQQIDSTENLLTLLIDGGETEELLDDVKYCTPPETMNIYNELMSSAPYLSDTVVGIAIEKEDVLPDAMIRDIMVANPKSAKSKKMMNKLDERYTPLPDYMKAQILQGRSILSIREETEAALAGFKAKKARAFNTLKRYYRNDTLNPQASADSILVMFQNDNELWAKYALAFEYVSRGDSTNAINTLGSIPVNFNLAASQLSAHQGYEDYVMIIKGLTAEGKTVFQADSADKVAFYSLYDNSDDNIHTLLRNLLVAIDTLAYQEPYIFPDLLKSSQAYEDYQEIINTNQPASLTVHPNPAKDYIIIEYMQEMDGSGYVSITDLNGKPVTGIHLSNVHDQKVLDTKNWKAGIYIATLKIGDKKIESVKFSITN